jgi:rhamnosyltransferase
MRIAAELRSKLVRETHEFSQRIEDVQRSSAEAIAEKERVSSELQAALAQTERGIEELQAVLALRQQSIEELQAVLAQRQQSIEELQAALGQKQQSIEELEAALAQRQQSINELQAGASDSERLIAYISDRYRSSMRKRTPKRLRQRTWLALQRQPVQRSFYRLIGDSVFFDQHFYFSSNPDVRASGIDAVVHYVKFGSREGRDPSPFVSEFGYRERYPDVAFAGLSAVEHYERYGRHEGRTLLASGMNFRTLATSAPVTLPRKEDRAATGASHCDDGSIPSSSAQASTSQAHLSSKYIPDSVRTSRSASEQSGPPATLPWPPRVQLLTRPSAIRRMCIFSFYDPDGIVDDYVVFFLQKLGEFSETIIFYSKGPLARDSEIKLHGVVDDVVLRPNAGFDVTAYREGLERIDYNREGLYDEVLMINHTCYGPVFPFSELFGEMERRDCDFWSISAQAEMTPNPLTGVGTLPYHLNSNFIAVRAGMLGSRSFRQYWRDEEAVMSHETRFTEYFTKLGYEASVYLNRRPYGSHYPLMLNLDETLIDRSPLIERRALFHDPRFLDHYAADLPRALSILAKTSDYNPELIWRSAVRRAELRTLNTNAALTSVLPDVRLKQNAPLPDNGAVAVCVHLYYVDMLEEILSFTDTIPTPYDFIATTDTEAKKAAIEQTVAGRKNTRNVIVRLVEQNRGRDMSALFITCRDLFLDNRYSLVCRLHTKKSPQVAAGRGNLFKRHQFENLLNSEGFTTNVLDMFHDKPWIGVAVPPIVQISYSHLGRIWYNNLDRALELKELLGLKVPFDLDTPVGAFGTMFWFRPKALRKLFEYNWEWTDYNSEPHHVDGSLAHVQERLICYVAQDAGYTTEQIISSHLAGWNYAMMEYKLQKLLAKLPNWDFSDQDRMLQEWCAAGYPMSAVSVLPSPAVNGGH